MSKSKSNRKWYDDEYDNEYDTRRKNQDRRNQKKMKNALRSKSFAVDTYVDKDD